MGKIGIASGGKAIGVDPLVLLLVLALLVAIAAAGLNHFQSTAAV
jgi:hypothetical protein